MEEGPSGPDGRREILKKIFTMTQWSSTTALLTPEVGGRFFVVSTPLKRVGPNSKKGKRQGKGEKDKEKRKAQSRPECPMGIHTDSDRYKSQFSRSTSIFVDMQHQNGEGLYSTGIHQSLCFVLEIQGDHLKGNHCKCISLPSIRISLAFYSGTSNLLNLSDRSLEGEDWARPIQTTPGEEDDYSTKEVIEALTYSGVGAVADSSTYL
ncbi:hypothetical protein K435DRAFT_798466 [Dendrothele bispora CBS 962.96]|uniref:Uncharacterized protein n=1 Tax=Dendrothele bispora (strain CBS 962.96) TaxID=1314807 RepID=A0A4S8LZF2_DENBC|nr:hypothetical protein K435DRAFT_798466 [Dendrothele bispora CBS 962.96]